MRKIILVLPLMLSLSCFGQNVLEQKVYSPLIKTVKMEVEGTDFSFPVIDLKGEKRLLLKFDELTEDTKRYEYKIIHCNADWTQSDLDPMQYIEGFESGMIESYTNSFNTIERYVHYQQTIPHSMMRFLASGNYIIKVYEEYNEDKVIFISRFYVCDNTSAVGANVMQARDPSLQRLKQEIDVSVTPIDAFSFSNPRDNIKVLVQQNCRRDNISLLKLHQIKGITLDYSFDQSNIFDGGNEFRNIDFTSLRTRSLRVAKIDYLNERNNVFIVKEADRGKTAYSSAGDINGHYFVRNDYTNDYDITSDYSFVHFVFPTAMSLEGSYYIVGELSDWHLSEQNRMSYDKSLQAYTASLFLKQGFYDYMIYFKPANSSVADISKVEGNHSETENEYHVLVYYRKPGDRYDSLIGYCKVIPRF
ncbi:MAG: DUF5103 domain-containing protein [Bacteroidales bacterium]|jgi:hypothetical protein|nr:DUF5103 domain-containing protein [Bacteroidales bacterium]